MSNAIAHPPRDSRRERASERFVARNGDLIVSPTMCDGDEHVAAELADVLNSLQAKLPRQDVVSVLRGLDFALRHEEDAEHSSLTEAETAALRAAGSLVEPVDVLPIGERPSVQTALRQQALLAEALTTGDVAGLLDVSTGRIRQRAGEGSLFAMHGAGRGLRFPRFQFTDQGELPGWSTVCRVLPEHANPVAVEYFLTHTHPDLADGELTPTQWLAAGRPADQVAALAEQAFTIR